MPGLPGYDTDLECDRHSPGENVRSIHCWLCRLFGHKYDPEIAEYYGIARCERKRCNYESTNFETGIVQLWLWKASSFFNEKLSGIRSWITCPHCKWHFGQHNLKNDHIPF